MSGPRRSFVDAMVARTVAFALLGLMPATVVHAGTTWVEGNVEQVAATGDGRFGGCMAELDMELADAGLDCAGRWVNFGCDGDGAATEDAGRVFDAVRAAVAEDKSVGMRVTDEDKRGGYCRASRIKVQDEPHVDEDSDADGVFDLDDDVPLDASETVDTDDDGIGNNADPDDDNDGVADGDDAFPLDPDEHADSDGDGIGDNADPDPDDASWIIETVAGQTFVPRPADEAYLRNPRGVAADAAGNVYIPDGHRVRRVDAATGVISTFAGTGGVGFGGDGGPADEALLNSPDGVAADAAGNVYIADTFNDRVRRVDAATGVISTFAGTGEEGFGGDGGPADEALLHFPSGVAADAAGNVYIADRGNDRVRRVEAGTGVISTFAGTGEEGFGGDGGPADEALLDYPWGVAADAAGNVYIADRFNHRVRRVEAGTGVISTFAGTGEYGFGGDGGPAGEAQLADPSGVAADAAGNVYIADRGNDRVRRVEAGTGVISTFAGTGEEGFGGDGGPADEALLNFPWGVAADAAGNVYIADWWNDRVRRVEAGTGVISTFAGRGGLGDGGPAGEALLYYPRETAVDAAGNVYIADTYNHRVRRVEAGTGVISTFAGTGEEGFGGDGGPADEALLDYPEGVAADAAGNVYIVDHGNHRVRRVDAGTGVISTFAGTGEEGFGGDGGPAGEALLYNPWGVAADAAGNVYIADTGNRRVRRVDAGTGVISTFAGTGEDGFGGDGGPADEALLDLPRGVAADEAGNVYIADTGNNRVRRVDAETGVISTFAGSGSVYGGGFGGDGGSAGEARLDDPRGVAVDAVGNVYIADTGNNRVRRVEAGTGVISTFAGSGSVYGGGFGGDGGPAGEALLDYPSGVAVDAVGNVYIADTDNHLVRRVSGPDDVGDNALDFAPANPTVFDDRVVGSRMIVVDSGNHVDFLSGGRFRETRGAEVHEGTYSYAYRGSNQATLVLDYDDGDRCSYELTFDSRTAGRLSYSCNGGDQGESSWHLADTPAGGGSDAAWIIETIAGQTDTDGRPGNKVSLSSPWGVAVDAAGNVYIADSGNNRVLRLDVASGTVSTFAGSGDCCFGDIGDGGPAIDARLNFPTGVAVDRAGNVYVADAWHHRVRRVDAVTSDISTFAGTGEPGFVGDGGPAIEARLHLPGDVAVDAAGNMYIADTDNDRVRRVDAATGDISTFAGSDGYGFEGDGGPADEAKLDWPLGISVDATGDVYIADSGNHRVRRVDFASGTISTFAGSGYGGLFGGGFEGDGGLANEALLNSPDGVAVDSAGNVYISDTDNNRLRRVDAATGEISTVAGTGERGFGGDGGPAIEAHLNEPSDVAVDAAGNVYIADRENDLIRRVSPPGQASSATSTAMMGTGG